MISAEVKEENNLESELTSSYPNFCNSFLLIDSKIKISLVDNSDLYLFLLFLINGLDKFLHNPPEVDAFLDSLDL